MIETERLVLRPLSREDLEVFVALHEDPEVTRFIGQLDRREAAERLRAYEREWRERGHGMFAVHTRGEGRFVGRVGLKFWPQFDETEVAWTLRRDAWGHGYATEAGRACIEWGFATLTVPNLTAMINPDNVGSIAVARRLRMAPMRSDELLGDPLTVYSISRQDWAGSHSRTADSTAAASRSE